MDSQQERLTKLVADTIVMLCKNGVRYEQRLRIQGLIGITSDDGSVMLIPINETLGCQMTAGNEACTSSGMPTYGDPQPQRIRGAPSGRRRRPRGGRYNNVADRSVPQQMYDDGHHGYAGDNSILNQYDTVKTEGDVKQEGYDNLYADGDNYFDGQNDYSGVPAADQNWTMQNSGTIDLPFSAGFGDIGTGGTSVQVHRTIQYTSTAVMQPAADDYGAEFSSNTNDYGMPPPAKRGRPSQSGAPQRGGGRGRPPKAAGEMSQPSGASREELGTITDDKSKWETVKVYRFACKLCSRIFNHQPNLFQHQITAHGRPKKERGAGRGAVDGHDPDPSRWETVKVAKFACKLCGALFNHQPNLFQHQITNHGRPKKVRGGGGQAGFQDAQHVDY